MNKLNRIDLRILAWLAILVALVGAVSMRCVGSEEYGATDVGRRVLVMDNGQIKQLPTNDWLSTLRGLTTNATAPTGSGDIQTTTGTSSGVWTNGGNTNTAQTVRTGVITAAMSSSQNDWAPTGLATASQINVTLAANATWGGLVAQPNGTEILIRNTSASFTISMSVLSTGSLEANRFDILSTFILQPYATILLRYNGSQWVGIAWGGGGYGGVNNWTVGSVFNVGEIRGAVIDYTTTGTSHDLPSSNTLIWQYSGAGTATITGFLSPAAGRFLFVQNKSAFDLTLANETGSLAGRQLRNPGAVDIVLSGTPTTSSGYSSNALYVYDGGTWNLMAYSSLKVAAPIQYTSTKTKGTITLAAGTGTATTVAGSVCTCTDTTATLPVQCAVSGTTLTATGTTTDVIAYICL